MRPITFNVTFYDDDLISFAKSFKNKHERNVIIKFAVKEYIKNHPDNVPKTNMLENITEKIENNKSDANNTCDTNYMLGFLK